MHFQDNCLGWNKQDYVDVSIDLIDDAPLTEGICKIQGILSEPAIDLNRLKEGLIILLQYLCSERGRTDQNCREVDAFFSHNDLWAERDLPEDFRETFAFMSEALHDAVRTPEVAENFGCTPEQLLDRAKKLNT